MVSKKISWSKMALKQFDAAIKHIMSDSPQNAEKVRIIILDKIYKIPDSTEKYPPDKYKLNNKGNYRAFEIYHYRVAYHIGKEGIKILRVRHTSMEPKEY